MTQDEARAIVLALHPHSHEAITADKSFYVIVDGVHSGVDGLLTSNAFSSPDGAWMDAANRIQGSAR